MYVCVCVCVCERERERERERESSVSITRSKWVSVHEREKLWKLVTVQVLPSLPQLLAVLQRMSSPLAHLWGEVVHIMYT